MGREHLQPVLNPVLQLSQLMEIPPFLTLLIQRLEQALQQEVE
jgi:hypothetical protein